MKEGRYVRKACFPDAYNLMMAGIAFVVLSAGLFLYGGYDAMQPSVLICTGIAASFLAMPLYRKKVAFELTFNDEAETITITSKDLFGFEETSRTMAFAELTWARMDKSFNTTLTTRNTTIYLQCDCTNYRELIDRLEKIIKTNNPEYFSETDMTGYLSYSYEFAKVFGWLLVVAGWDYLASGRVYGKHALLTTGPAARGIGIVILGIGIYSLWAARTRKK